MINTDTMKQVYLLAQEHCGLKVGDRVKLTRIAEDYEAGWNNPWCSGFNDEIGSIGIITEITKYGIAVAFPCSPIVFCFPYFVLEKVEKPAHKFKPFDKVLVRDDNDEEWKPQLFSRYVEDGIYIYYTLVEDSYAQCIPYEGNEHLVGTTDMLEE